jgi:hypothetical protein
VRIDRLVDLLIGGGVAGELAKRRDRKKDHQGKGEQAKKLSMHVSISG